MGEEEIFQRCIRDCLLISREHAHRRMNRVAIRKQRSNVANCGGSRGGGGAVRLADVLNNNNASARDLLTGWAVASDIFAE